MKKMRNVGAALAALALVLAGCGSEPAAGSGAEIIEEAPAPETEETEKAPEEALEGPEEAPEEESAPEGTREAPVAVGTAVAVDDWEVSVTSVEPDAWEEIREENEFNEPPSDGSQYVMWRVEMTYVGSDSGDPFWDVMWKFVGSGGNSFDAFCENAVVIPDDLMNAGETFPDASVEGNVCAEVASEQFDGGTIMVETLFGSGRVFFATD